MDLKKLIRECVEEVLSEANKICAWCKKKVGEIPGDLDTHGICFDCQLDQYKKEGIPAGRKICSICKKVVGVVPGIDGDTHTICQDCKPRFKEWLKNRQD